MKAKLIADDTYFGGAERSLLELSRCFEKSNLEPDFYLVGNVTQYDSRLIREIEDKPVVKIVHDVWPHADRQLRAWLLQNAALLVFKSPWQLDIMKWRYHITAPTVCIPGPIDVSRFVRARSDNRSGAVWLGRLEPHKGINYAIGYAVENGIHLDIYGDGPQAQDLAQFEPHATYRGRAAYDDVPKILGKAKQLIHLPAGPDACPRVILEAYAAGCEIVTNKMQGASYWINEAPDKIETAKDDFMKAVTDAL